MLNPLFRRYCSLDLANPISCLGFFISGLIMSLHCIGMCGPIVMASTQKDFLSPALYHGARLSLYMVLGYLVSYSGHFHFSAPPWLSLIYKLMSGLVLIYGLYRFSKPATRRGFRWVSRLSGNFKALISGLLTAMLPCGLLYAMLVASLTAPSPMQASAWMLCFGLGTLPALSLSNYWLKSLLMKRPLWLRQSAALMILALGLINLQNRFTLETLSSKDLRQAQSLSCH